MRTRSRPALLIALLLAACASGRPAPPAAPDPETHVREVLALVGIDGSLQQWHALALENASVYQLVLDTAQQGELQAAIDSAFGPQRLQEAVVAHFVASYDGAALRSVERWSRSPLGERIRELEAQAGSDEARPALASFTDELSRQPPTTIRASLVTRLDQALRSSENLIALRIGTRRALGEGLRPWLGEERVGGAEELEAQLAEMREQVASVTPAGVRVMMLFSLRDLPIVKLVRYAEWAERPASQWYFTTQSAALEHALAESGAALAAEVERIMATQAPPDER